MPISILDWTLAGTPNVPAGDGSLPIIPYVRVSTEKQAKEGVSLKVQQAAIVAWAKEQGVELDEFVIDVKSGESIFARPLLVEVLDRTLRNEAGGIVVFDGDRLARCGSVMHEMVVAPFRRAGRLFEVHQTPTDDSAEGNLVRRIMENVKQFERERIAERTRRTMQWKKAQGKAVGTAPYGFSYEAGVRGTVQKDTFVPEWPEYGVWLYVKGLVAGCSTTIRELVDILEAEGIPPPRSDGNAWRLSNVHRVVAHVCQVEGWETRPGKRRAQITDEDRDAALAAGADGFARAREMLREEADSVLVEVDG
jgi:DNA invertase Pin-like site-specific DNA recombinase